MILHIISLDLCVLLNAFMFLHGVCLAALAAEELGFERFHSVIQ